MCDTRAATSTFLQSRSLVAYRPGADIAVTMLPAVTVANAAAFEVPKATVARLERHLRLTAAAQRRIDPDFFVASVGFHRGEVDGFNFVFEYDADRITAYVVSVPRSNH